MTTAQTQARSTDTALTMTAAFEGIEGAYSHVVLEAYAGRRGVTFAPLGCATFRAVAHAVLGGRADVGLLPIDNAIAGTIREGYDVLAEYELDPLAEITLRLEHRLVGLPGATLEGVREVAIARDRPGRVRPLPRDPARRQARPGRRHRDRGPRRGRVQGSQPRGDLLQRGGRALRSGRTGRLDRRPPRQHDALPALPRPGGRRSRARFRTGGLRHRPQDLADLLGRRQAGRARALARRVRQARPQRLEARLEVAPGHERVRVLRRRRRRSA